MAKNKIQKEVTYPYFSAPLTVTKLRKRLWCIEKPFMYWLDESCAIKIFAGMVTDFASVPRLFTNIIPKDGQYSQAAVVHDWLYQNCGIMPNVCFTRKQCDIIFLQAMEVLHVSKIKRKIMYRSIRIFGWYSWSQQKKVLKGNKMLDAN